MATETSREYIARTAAGSHSDIAEVAQPPFFSTSNASNVYELSQCESLTFLYNLLYDEQSSLSNTDILSLLSALKHRETNLPFFFAEQEPNRNVQGVSWGCSIRRKFYQERSRIGGFSWFTNVPNSRHQAKMSLKMLSYDTKTDFFRFHRFYSRLKNHITHLQLRSLVVCGDNIANGIFYPSSYFHDNNLDPIMPDHNEIHGGEYHGFFKMVRLMPDETSASSEAMKLDCLVDSRKLRHNQNSRISSMASSDKFLVSGTFEGGLILMDIEDPENVGLVGEVSLTKSADGITNDICISKDNSCLTVASNDAKIRIFDIHQEQKIFSRQLPFAANSIVSNPANCNEYFIAADKKENYILDRRCLRDEYFNPSVIFTGHKDYGFSCDWSPSDENILVSGNQDGTVRIWDRRWPNENVHNWNSALGSHAFDIDGGVLGGPVRNCKFSRRGNYVVWGESLDHVGIIQMNDLLTGTDPVLSRVQSIDFIGKCIGLNVCQTDTGWDEDLVIGINDCPLGGILSYRLDAPDKPLPFDFYF